MPGFGAPEVYINDGIQGMIRTWGTEAVGLEARQLLVLNMCLALAVNSENILKP